MLSQSCEPADMPAPSPPATPSTSDLADHPLSELSPNAQRYLDGRQGRWGIAVVIPSQEAIYVSNADQPMSMASVVKVVIMLAVMDRAIKEEQPLTSWEQQQLRLMITESDNDAATALWEALGGADAVEAYLQSIDMTGIYPNPQEAWGASRATPRAVALLFAKLALGEILDQPSRKLAMELLAEVVPSQRWGVSAGLPNDLPPGTIVGIKDGWYPAESGWWVNSAGVILPGDNRPNYTIAVLTQGQPTMEYGIDTIEGAVAPVHRALLGTRPFATYPGGLFQRAKEFLRR